MLRSEIGAALGQGLRRIRQDKGLELAEVSALSNVSRSYLYEIERGDKEPSWVVLAAICDALDVSLRVSLHQRSMQASG